ncbi:MAG: hydantoinase B/oxoprolinase family protein [bacterium]|nr:hydantoinase B/oxoprolinase family protein [bacterium]
MDRGGTFTDIYATTPLGPRQLKLLSENPGAYADAPTEGIRRVLEEVLGQPQPPGRFSSEPILSIRMGTTVATNALLERKGEPMALVITQGFGDLLQIGNQNRPKLFDLKVEKPALLYQAVLEVKERIRPAWPGDKDLPQFKGTDGRNLVRLVDLDLEALRAPLSNLLEQGVSGLAVVLAHSYRWGEHERQIGALARQLGFSQISLSHQVMPRPKLVARGDTACVDAYLTPKILRYLADFKAGFIDQLEGVSLLFMQSDGGLVPHDRFAGHNAILSGPAGGVVGLGACSAALGERPQLIGFDMGGTSTDVSRWAGELEQVQESETAGVRIQAPQLYIKTVAAGGGSRLSYRQGVFQVGPESAGAHPGPACYRKGGPLCVTDANLFLGRLQAKHFPPVFGPKQDQPLDPSASAEGFARLSEEINRDLESRGLAPMSVEEVALGFLKVANAAMARPIREISVLRGFDAAQHWLGCFGGAGGQHACAIARELGMTRILVPRYAGILSAYGIAAAAQVSEARRPGSGLLDAVRPEELERRFEELEAQASLGLEGPVEGRQRYAALRYQGTDTQLMVPLDHRRIQTAFESEYLREFGFTLQRPLLLDELRVRLSGVAQVPQPLLLNAQNTQPQPLGHSRAYFDGGWVNLPCYSLESLAPGPVISGPALVLQAGSTLLLEPGSSAQLNAGGDLEVLLSGAVRPKKGSTQQDPVRLSIFANLFMSIAEQMGRSLQNTAISTNIKERRDFSCALFDRAGHLVANAPHQPVHLGSMGAAVRAQLARFEGHLESGDHLLSNHPSLGGSHLPDLTVITPVFTSKALRFLVASRGHHADIGGLTPGSMPPFSTRLEQEGAAIEGFKLVAQGQFDEAAAARLLKGSRALADNLSDLKAQVAANQRGVQLLNQLMEEQGEAVVLAYMGYIMDQAATAVTQMLQHFCRQMGIEQTRQLEAVDYLDDGSPLVLKLTLDPQGHALFDFSDSADQLEGNLNAPPAITTSAVLYCLRAMVGEEIPLNEGCLGPVEIRLRPGSLLWPGPEAAVVGGNVLTSQRIVDVIFRAFGAAAASQGCMNNLTFGDHQFGYYETIGGGAGAGPDWVGQSGVQCHMTNTRITDPEVLESRYPVCLRRFSLRPGSGGAGLHGGGLGLVRQLEFLKDLKVSILSERRVYAPYGLQGGTDGQRGVNSWCPAQGGWQALAGKVSLEVHRGDQLKIETPGGGGWGLPKVKP